MRFPLERTRAPLALERNTFNYLSITGQFPPFIRTYIDPFNYTHVLFIFGATSATIDAQGSPFFIHSFREYVFGQYARVDPNIAEGKTVRHGNQINEPNDSPIISQEKDEIANQSDEDVFDEQI